jgi:sarcosine oxidase subunit alpha
MTNQIPVGLTAMHHRHLLLGATMVERDGWQRPARYTSVENEVQAVRQAVGLCDISPGGKIRLQGKDAGPRLRSVYRKFGELEVGRASTVRLEQESNGQDAIVMGLASDDLLILTAPSQATSTLQLLSKGTEECAHAVDVSSGLAGVKVAGPEAHRLLSAVTPLNISPSAFPDMTCAQGMAAEIHGTVLRHDIGGILSYDLYFGREFGEYMWDALVEAGEEYGVLPFGIDALDSLA